MIELTYKESRWLKALAKESEFFTSLLEFYKENGCLTQKQYDCLDEDINFAKDNGDKVLNKEDFKLLTKMAKKDDILTEVLEYYKEVG